MDVVMKQYLVVAQLDCGW